MILLDTHTSSDRILVAIARRYDIPLISCDEKILAYSHVRAVW
jgi:PIN domain nuclease of toxin-antitoxin system